MPHTGKQSIHRTPLKALRHLPKSAHLSGRVSNSRHYLSSRHRVLQYFTSSQFLSHFFRHSNGKPQRTQTFGAKPFFVFACLAISYCKTVITFSLTDASRIRQAHRVAQMHASRCFPSETHASHTKNWCSCLAKRRESTHLPQCGQTHQEPCPIAKGLG